MEPTSDTPPTTPPPTPPTPPAPTPLPVLPTEPNSLATVVGGKPIHPKRKFLYIALVVLVVAAGVAYWLLGHHAPKTTLSTTPTTSTSSKSTVSSKAAATQGLQLDTTKNYGNKYATGLLPVGDGKYSTSTAKVGSIYACSQYAQNLASGQGGASTRGPWFSSNNTQYNINNKSHVSGSVMWQASFTNTVSGSTRTIVTNDLPNHPTGIFPIASTDPAYAYDHNPNHIAGQTLTYALNANPTYGSPQCMGGESGVMLTGIALFNAFDAGGHDAGAWEVQDKCDGHPDASSEYHYHTLSSCISDTSVHTVIGFALDGFPITGPKVGTNNILTTSDLDECHGLTSLITLDGKQVTTYHYVMTQDFPYSLSCFRGTAIQPPNLKSGSQASSGSSSNQPPSSGQTAPSSTSTPSQNTQPVLGAPANQRNPNP